MANREMTSTITACGYMSDIKIEINIKNLEEALTLEELRELNAMIKESLRIIVADRDLKEEEEL